MDMNVIKSYLVQLGAKVDDTSWNQTTAKLRELEKSVTSATANISKAFVTSATAITGALAGVTTATAGLLDHVSQLDLGYQKFALRMYMSTQQAKELKIVTDAMGENINDIAWIPELRERYMALMAQTRQLEGQVPGGSEAQLKSIRDIRFEFTRLKVEATYALQWIAYYLIKYLSGPLGDIKGGLSGLNDWLTQHMPEWTQKVAKFIGDFVIGINKLLPSVKNLIDWLGDIPAKLDKLKESFNNAGDAAWEFGAILVTLFKGVSLSIAILTGLIVGIIKHLQEIGTIDGMWTDFGDTVKNVTSTFDDFTKSVAESLEKNGSLTALTGAFKTWKTALVDIDKGLTSLLRDLGLLGQKKGIGDMLANEFSRALTQIAKTASAIGHILSALGKVMAGDVKGATSELLLVAKDMKTAFSAAGVFSSGSNSSSASKSSSAGDNTGSHMGKQIADSVAGMSGLPANLIYGQMAHETANFTDLAGDYNYGGLKNSDGSYKNFSSKEEFEKYYAWYLRQYDENGISSATTPQEWAHALKQGGYYEDSESNYASGIENWSQYYQNASFIDNMKYRAAMLNNYSVGTGANAASSIDNSVATGNINIYITEPGANADQIKNAVVNGIKQANNKSNSRMISQFAGVGVSV